MELVQPIVEMYRRMSCELPADVVAALEDACGREEEGTPAHDAMLTILKNVRLARETSRPLCQDTGTPVFHVAKKGPTPLTECEIREAILQATREATRLGYLRPNAVDSLTGENSGDNTGEGFPVIHVREAAEEVCHGPDASGPCIEDTQARLDKPAVAQPEESDQLNPLSPQRGERVRVRGGKAEEALVDKPFDRLTALSDVEGLSGVEGLTAPSRAEGPPVAHDYLVIDAMLKGGGCENVGVRYQLPDASLGASRDIEGVRRCVLDAVHRAQGRGCPPYILGVAIGGARDATAALAKRQLLHKLDDASPNDTLAELEAQLRDEANRLGIGPAGFGGRTTVLAVKAASQHRHCACYFVEVSFGCWAMRRGRLILSEDGARHE